MTSRNRIMMAAGAEAETIRLRAESDASAIQANAKAEGNVVDKELNAFNI